MAIWDVTKSLNYYNGDRDRGQLIWFLFCGCFSLWTQTGIEHQWWLAIATHFTFKKVIVMIITNFMLKWKIVSSCCHFNVKIKIYEVPLFWHSDFKRPHLQVNNWSMSGRQRAQIEIMLLCRSCLFFVRNSNQQNYQSIILVLKGVIKDIFLYVQHFLIPIIPSGT